MKNLAHRHRAARWSTAFALIVAAALAPRAADAADVVPDFSGTWELVPAKSSNLGMMSAMHLTLVIAQSPTALDIRETTVFQGQPSQRALRYDLTGKPVSNPAAMGGMNETVAAWKDGRLVVTWTGEGAIAGTKVVRTETRSLAPDGATMSVESVRGATAPLIMVFERRK